VKTNRLNPTQKKNNTTGAQAVGFPETSEYRMPHSVIFLLCFFGAGVSSGSYPALCFADRLIAHQPHDANTFIVSTIDFFSMSLFDVLLLFV
jgi:hypothetical protein